MNVAAKPPIMTVDQFLDWVSDREGRYELVDGNVVAISPERSRHVDSKMNAWEILRNAVREAGLDCFVKGDGMTVVIDKHNSCEPDVSVQCSPIDPESMILDNPLIVLEVISPSSARRDTGTKLASYFQVGSIRHYLIIDTYGKSVIKHSNAAAGAPISSEVFRAGSLRLDPPGISVSIDDILGLDANLEARS